LVRLTKDELIPENFYDIVIDKACIDCISSNPERDNIINAFNEIKKIMTDHASFYHITTNSPESKGPVISVNFQNTDVEDIKIAEKTSKEISELIDEESKYFLYKIKK
jgi:hypothetical protein